MIEGENWTDGGVRNIIPIEEALRLGATEIDMITTSPVEESFSYSSNNVISSLLTVIGILLDEVLDTDMLLGTLIAGYEDIPLRILAPDKGLSSGLDFNQELVKLNRETGYRAAQSVSWG